MVGKHATTMYMHLTYTVRGKMEAHRLYATNSHFNGTIVAHSFVSSYG